MPGEQITFKMAASICKSHVMYHIRQWHISSKSILQIITRPNGGVGAIPNPNIRWITRSSVHQSSTESTSQRSTPASPLQEEEEPDFYTPLAVEKAEQASLLLARPSSQPESSKLTKVAIVGTPNAGKSTLINCLLGRRICAVSQKVHTTRSNALAVITRKDTQMVLLDTPGLISFSKGRRHKLPRSLMVDAKNTLLEANLVAILVDASNKWTNMKLDEEVLLQLHNHSDVPAVLVLNKVDALQDKQALIEITEALTEGIVDGTPIRAIPVRGRRHKGGLPDSGRTEAQPGKGGSVSMGASQSQKEMRHEHGDERVLGDVSDSKGASQPGSGTAAVQDSDLERTRHTDRTLGHSDEGAAGNHLNHTTLGRDDSLGALQAESHAIPHENQVTGESHDQDMTGKRGILQDYVTQLRQFVEADGGTAAASWEKEANAAARQQRLDEREKERKVKEREEKRELLRIVRKASGWPHFKAVFMISALHGDGVKELRDYLMGSAVPGDWEYHEDVITNLSPEEILTDAIREKLLETLPQEVPYSITQSTEMWQTGENGELSIDQYLICQKKSHVRMLEKKIGWVARQARQNLMDAFHCEVNLRLYVKMNK